MKVFNYLFVIIINFIYVVTKKYVLNYINMYVLTKYPMNYWEGKIIIKMEVKPIYEIYYIWKNNDLRSILEEFYKKIFIKVR